jgi:hypothetical protein
VGTGWVYDRLILVVNNRKTKTQYDEWVTRWSAPANRTWLEELPAAYSALAPPTTNWLGTVNRDPEPVTTNLWANKVDTPGRYMHHIATWQMRSNETSGGHGHQACYDMNGTIILAGVSAGTADFGCAAGYNPVHVELDVDPFVRALQLDGNPCNRSFWSLTHALIFSGERLQKYQTCRPPIPNTKTLLQPGTVPQ